MENVNSSGRHRRLTADSLQLRLLQKKHQKKLPRACGTGQLEKIQATTYFRFNTIIGPGRLNGRVRNGNGCDSAGMITWKW